MKDRITGILTVITILSLTVSMCLYLANEQYEIKIDELSELVDNQATLLIDEKNNCDCGWYEDFYYNHAEEVGAYE